MIFFENNSGKMTGLIMLVAIGSIFFIWGWFKFNPLVKADNNQDNQYWSELFDNTKESASQIQNNWQVAGEELENMQAEFDRQQKADALLDATKQYLNNTSTITSTPL